MKILKFLSSTSFSFAFVFISEIKIQLQQFSLSFSSLHPSHLPFPLVVSQIMVPGLFLFNLEIYNFYHIYKYTYREIYISKYGNIIFPEEDCFLPPLFFLSSLQVLPLGILARSIHRYLHNNTAIISINLHLHPSGWPHIDTYICNTNQPQL